MSNNSTVDIGQLQQDELYWGLTIAFFVLIIGLWFISYLRTRKILWFPESAALLIIGVILGLILRYQQSNSALALDDLVQFNSYIFFIIFLPPIVFEAAYSFKNVVLARNVFMICLLAFLGTFLTMIITGLIMYGAGQSSSAIYQMSLVNNLIFGAAVSATDPVAVLIVFSTLGADVSLFALVLGEAVLNDAVALVLYQTMLQFQNDEPTPRLVVLAVLTFCGIFLASMAIGTAIGIIASLFFKIVKYSKYPTASRIECGLMIAIPYLSYFLAQAAGFSGITSISFCGIALSEYASTSLSESTEKIVEEGYGAVAQTFEAFTFIFMGIAFSNLEDTDPAIITYAMAAFGAILAARAVHVLICVFIGNLARPRKTQINVKGTFALFVVGLRGPMAFFVSLQAANQVTNRADGAAMVTITVILICITTPLIGFIMPYLVRVFSLNIEGSASTGGWTCRGANGDTDQKGNQTTEVERAGLFIRLFLKLDTTYLRPCLASKSFVDTDLEPKPSMATSDKHSGSKNSDQHSGELYSSPSPM